MAKDPATLAESYIIAGHYYKDKSLYDSAAFYYNRALIKSAEHNDKKHIAEASNGLGIIILYQGDYGKALTYFLRSAQLYEDMADSSKIAMCYGNIGSTFIGLNNVDKGIEYLTKAVQVRELMGLSQNSKNAQLLNNLAYVYSDKKNEFDKAIEYLEKALVINKRNNNSVGLAYNYQNFSLAFLGKREFNKALSFGFKALEINRNLDAPYEIIGNLSAIASVYNSMNQYDSAKSYFNAALELALAKKATILIPDLYLGLHDISKKEGEFEQALQFYKLHVYFKDSLFNIESTQKTNELLTKYESEKKQKEIERLNTENKERETQFYKLAFKTYVAIALLIIIILLIIIRFIKRDIKLKNNQIKAEQLTSYHQKKYKTLFESVPDGIIIRTQKKLVIDANKSIVQMLGFSYIEIIGRDCNELIHPESYERVQDLDQAIKNGETFSGEIQLRHKNGEKIITEVVATTIEQDGEKLTVGIFKDIREKKRVLAENEIVKKQQQKKIFETIIKTQEEERKRIAEDIHDGLGQMLTAVKMNLNMSIQKTNGDSLELGELLKTAFEISSDALSETKNISRKLVPLTLKNHGLIEGIKNICENNNKVSKVKIRFFSHSLPVSLGHLIEINAYRICQELITNIIKHSNATEANLQLFYRSNGVIIQAEDNGVGFEYRNGEMGGMGLKNIKGRVEMLHGELQVDTRQGRGTIITIEIPLQNPS